jgi:hypothetical protein
LFSSNSPPPPPGLNRDRSSQTRFPNYLILGALLPRPFRSSTVPRPPSNSTKELPPTHRPQWKIVATTRTSLTFRSSP